MSHTPRIHCAEIADVDEADVFEGIGVFDDGEALRSFATYWGLSLSRFK
jgi:hypothetical protein